jgi:tripartite-type tricarboxylate transporter receptor subunit TctC
MFLRWLVTSAFLLIACCTPSLAEDWPTRPIRAIVPFTPGSATDIIPRTVFAEVQKQLGQPIIIENRVGAGGTIGIAAAAKSAPDGYTILVASSAYTTVPATYANLPYDPMQDLHAVIPLANMANVLVVSPDKGMNTLDDFVKQARARQGSMNYVTLGVGSAAHLNAERFRLAAKFDAQPVPYKGAPEGLMEVMTGRIDFYFSPLLPAMSLIRDGKLKALAVSSAERSPDLAQVPTTTEAGYPDTDYNFWFGIFVPAKTPAGIVQRLYAETEKALRNPEVKEKLAKLGVQPMPMTSSQFSDYVRKEIEQNARLAKSIGIKPQ